MNKKHSLFVRFMRSWYRYEVPLMCQECWRESKTAITVWRYNKTASFTAGWCIKHAHLAEPTEYQEQFIKGES